MLTKIRTSGLAVVIAVATGITGFILHPQAVSFAALNTCSHLVRGTTVPNTSGQPLVISDATGTVISANFFNSGAIDTPFFDGLEFVSVCVEEANDAGMVVATIEADVGRDDDATIKGYPEFVFGSKFGNQYETSYRFYDNTGLLPEYQWPVVSANLSSSGLPFEFANLEYVSRVKGVGLPAFTSNLPDIDIVLSIEEFNVEGAERDVMLESWFYDTGANADLIGVDVVTGESIAGTLNNIVGAGHPHYDELNNLLLEMMVHLGPLSPNDVSGATRNPGKFQLTENYSGRDHDFDGIDDHFDVESHINAGTNNHPNPGVYSSGVDANGDGIDDADVLPVTIGSFQYSIWYGTTHLTPLVIFSRETNDTLTHDFTSDDPEMNLTEEGEISLNWNEFLDFTLYSMEPMLQAANVGWVQGSANPFPKMRSEAGAIGGLEIGVEPQTNAPSDFAYKLRFNELSVSVDGTELGLMDMPVPTAVDELVSPVGVVVNAQSTFVWKSVEYAEEYRIYVIDTEGNASSFFSPWISPVDLGCGELDVSCVYVADTEFDGPHRWRVQVRNRVGKSAWSDRADFEPGAPDPPEVVTQLLSPQGSVLTASPVLEWVAVSNADSYRIYVVDKDTGVADLLSDWISSEDLACDVDGVCSFDGLMNLTGSKRWRVKASNQSGQSAWSGRQEFIVESAPSDVAIPVAPVGALNSSPSELVWGAVALASEYRILLSDIDTGETQIYTGWLAAESLGCDAGSECRYVLDGPIVGRKKWRVRARNGVGATEWSPRTDFVVVAQAPPDTVSDLIYPAGVLSETAASLRWQGVDGAEVYRVLLVDIDSDVQEILSTWMASDDLGCAGGEICQFNLPGTVVGSKKWRVKARNTAGDSSWSVKQTFESPESDGI